MIFKSFRILLLVLFLGGCTYAAIPLKNDQISKVEKIGVVTFIGDEFSYGFLGLTAFNNYEKLVSQKHIDFDEEVTSILNSTIVKELASNPKPVQVINLKYDRDKLLSKYRIDGKYIKFDIKLAEAELVDIANTHDLEYLLVVTRGHNVISNNAGRMGGIGISKTAFTPEGTLTIHNYLDYKLFEVSTRTTPSIFSTAAMNFGQKRGVEFPWKQPLNEYSKKEIESLMLMIKEDLEYRVPVAIHYMLKWRDK